MHRKSPYFPNFDKALKIVQETECTRCGLCCRIPPAIHLEEAAQIARYLKISIGAFYERYVNQSPVQMYLKNPCPFYEKSKGCTIYSVRPLVCKAFPFQTDMPIIYGIDWCVTAGLLYLDITKGLEPLPNSSTLQQLALDAAAAVAVPKGCSKGDAFLQSTSRCLTVPLKDIEELYRNRKKKDHK
jgi:Fe-S-cluster containining protein